MTKIIAVDIDGTIATGKFWAEDCEPIEDNLEKINQLYFDGHTIIYHTARHPRYYELTYSWLVKHGAYFHALEMGKLTANLYIDDKALNVNDIDQLFD